MKFFGIILFSLIVQGAWAICPPDRTEADVARDRQRIENLKETLQFKGEVLLPFSVTLYQTGPLENTLDGLMYTDWYELGVLEANDIVKVRAKRKERTSSGQELFDIEVIDSQLNRRYGAIIIPAYCPISG